VSRYQARCLISHEREGRDISNQRILRERIRAGSGALKEQAPHDAPLIRCPCGVPIERPEQYHLIFLKKELHEIDILCPNEACYLRELGFLRFHMNGEEAVFDEGAFYPPFVTWNASQIGSEIANGVLTQHIKKLVKEQIDWIDIAQSVLKHDPSRSLSK